MLTNFLFRKEEETSLDFIGLLLFRVRAQYLYTHSACLVGFWRRKDSEVMVSSLAYYSSRLHACYGRLELQQLFTACLGLLDIMPG